MHVVIVDADNRLIADVSFEHKDVIENGKVCDIDFFEDDIRIRIKKKLVPNEKKNIKVEFYEDMDTDTVSAHYRNCDG